MHGRLLNQSFPTLIRWREWGQSKIAALIGGFFLAALSAGGSLDVTDFVAWLLGCFALFAFGYAVNDHSDRELDSRVGKRKEFHVLNDRQSAIFISVLAALVVASAWIISSKPWAAIVLLLGLACAAAYSMPPLRLKERGWLGILSAGAAQRAIPMGVGLLLLGTQPLVAIPLATLFLIIGIRWMLLHQMLDIENDRKGGLTTVATQRGADAIVGWMKFILIPAELALLFFVLLAGNEEAIAPKLLVIPVFLFWLLVKWRLYSGRISLFNLRAFWMHPLADLYETVMPVWFGMMLVSIEPSTAPAEIFLIILLVPAWWRRTESLRVSKRNSEK